ncbi:MAG: hypothetical protein ACF8GE_01260 [Phycisphaerales bacterium JB043]
MNRLMTSMAGLAVLSVSAIGASASGESSMTLRPKLMELRETRSTVFFEKDTQFSMPQEKPGIVMKFDLDLPEGLTMLSLKQPDELFAQDSTERSLTLIEEGFSGRQEFVEIVTAWDEPPTEFTFTLSSPSRSATRFTVESQFMGVFYEKTQPHTMSVGSEWVTLPAHLSSGQTIKFRAEQGNDSINLHVQPGSAKDLFDNLVMTTSKGDIEHNGTMWNDTQATFWFAGEFESSMELTMDVRVGLRELPIYVHLEDQPLP